MSDVTNDVMRYFNVDFDVVCGLRPQYDQARSTEEIPSFPTILNTLDRKTNNPAELNHASTIPAPLLTPSFSTFCSTIQKL